MPKKCGMMNCKGNYNISFKSRGFRLPKDELECQKWLSVLPTREGFTLDLAKFFICERQWLAYKTVVAVRGGRIRPLEPPSIPTPTPAPCPPRWKINNLPTLNR